MSIHDFWNNKSVYYAFHGFSSNLLTFCAINVNMHRIKEEDYGRNPVGKCKEICEKPLHKTNRKIENKEHMSYASDSSS